MSKNLKFLGLINRRDPGNTAGSLPGGVKRDCQLYKESPNLEKCVAGRRR